MTAAVVVLLLALAPAQLPKEVISEILVHGNHVTSDADVVKLAGITIGEPFGATTIADVTARLDPAEWQVVTAVETRRTVRGPGGREVELDDVVVRATRRP